MLWAALFQASHVTAQAYLDVVDSGTGITYASIEQKPVYPPNGNWC